MFTNVRLILGKLVFEGFPFSRLHRKCRKCSSSVSKSCPSNRSFRSPVKYTKSRASITDLNNNNVEFDEGKEDEKLDLLLDRTFLTPGRGHQVLVIQPYIKWGPMKKKNTTPELQLLESVTLIKTLRNWQVVDEIIISLESFNKKTFFGKGNLQSISSRIELCKKISAVFISANTLRLVQQLTLQEVFGVPVFDRYQIIMHIFKEHAQTKEAKLQVELAQLPYLWTILKGFNIGVENKMGVSASYLGGEGPKLFDDRKEVFKRREAKLKKQISELREYRQRVRETREKKEIPVVAVIGYTNAGKTSLIKALTGKESLEPQDYLFATLDVTCHLGTLPSGLLVYYVDTLGFITDIPTYLIESFVATLEDAIFANVIVHVRDISHPDTICQNENVVETLKKFNLPEKVMKNLIIVGNKTDLVSEEELNNCDDMILVSSTKMTGIDVLKQELEKKVIVSSNLVKMTFRVENGGKEYNWLHDQATVVDEVPDVKNLQYVMVKTIISPSALAKFKHDFIRNYKKNS